MLPDRFVDSTTLQIYEKARQAVNGPCEMGTLLTAPQYLTQLNRIGAQILDSRGFNTRLLEYRDGLTVIHAFIFVPGKTNGYRGQIFDWEYLRLVDPTLAPGMPAYMMVPFMSKSPIDDVIQGLKEHNIPQEKHCYWLSELF